MVQLDISAFEKIRETEYICEKSQRVSDHVEAERYDSAIGCLIMIHDEAKVAIDLIRKKKPA